MDIDNINLIINQKNKKRKLYLKNDKNNLYIAKITQKMLKPTLVDKKFLKAVNIDYSLYPEHVIKDNKQQLINISINLSQKLNSQNCLFRSVKSTSLVEYLAEICVNTMIAQKSIDIVKFVNARFNVGKLYKKELSVLPLLILNQLYTKLLINCSKLLNMQRQIKLGATFYGQNIRKKSNAFCYGYIKYNRNLLKNTKILTINFRKCVFEFIDELNKIEHECQILVSNIHYIYFNFKL